MFMPKYVPPKRWSRRWWAMKLDRLLIALHIRIWTFGRFGFRAFRKVRLPLINCHYPSLVTSDLASVQPMAKPTGRMFYTPIHVLPKGVEGRNLGQILGITTYMDGGTIEVRTEGGTYCIDSRIRTNTPGDVYLGYPDKNNHIENQQVVKNELFNVLINDEPYTHEHSEAIKLMSHA